MLISILGAGSWGIALSTLLRQNNHSVILWEFDAEVCRRLNSERTLPEKLPGIKIPDEIIITNELPAAVRDSEIIVLAVPSHTVRQVAENSAGLLTPLTAAIVNVSKGIENNTLLRISEVLHQVLPRQFHTKIATLSGPSHAEEVARNIPTTVVVASPEPAVSELVQQAFSTRYFRIYYSSDLIGVELGGSLKNVIAIAAGILNGLGMGDNTMGALLTRGLAEMVRLGRKLGADPMTFAGLSGIGDLITTCISSHSRNRYVGEQLGRGRKLPEILENMSMVAEGVKTTAAAYALSQKHQVEMPITAAVNKILFQGMPPEKAIHELMTRAPKPEIWG